MRQPTRSALFVAAIAGSAAATSRPVAASVFAGVHVIAARGNQIPGQAPGVTWGALNTPSVARDGRVAFSGSLVGVPAVNNLGIFTGTDASDTSLVVQSGTQAPGGPAGATMDLSGSSAGLQAATAKINADGVISFVSIMTGGGTVANVDNSGVFAGTASGGFGMLARRGTVVSGTGGAVHSSAFNTSVGSLPVNAGSTLYFGSAMTGGDVVGTSNNDAVFSAAGGVLSIIARRGASAPGVAGGLLGTLANPVPMMSNASGQALFGNTLTGVASTADSALYRHTPGVGLEIVAREGDLAPGTAGASFSGSFSLFTANFNNLGQAAFGATLAGGDVVGAANNTAIYVASPGNAALAWRAGMPAPGTDANFATTNAFNMAFDNAGRIAAVCTLTGGTSATTTDSGLWYGAPGALNLVAREGDAVPLLNATFNAISNVRANVLGQLLFTSSLLSGDSALNGKTALMAYDPGLGMFPLMYTGEQIEVAPGVFKTVTGFTSFGNSNSDGSGLTLSDTGWLTMKLTTSDSTDVIVRYSIPAPGPSVLLALAGLVIGRRRSRC